MRPQLTTQAAEWLEETRAIPSEIAANLGIVSRPGAIGFQYLDRDGTVLWTKWRGSGKKFWIEPAGSKLIPWNLQSCREIASFGNTLIVTEGEFDAASCVVAGFPCSISVPNGARPAHREGLNRDVSPEMDKAYAWMREESGELILELQVADKIILALDNDEPGRALFIDLAIILNPERCYLVRWPEGCKDANEVLIKYGAEKLRHCLETAIQVKADIIRPVPDLPDRDRVRIFKSGWSKLDANLSCSTRQLIVVTGKPGAGKSRWTLNWMLNMARIYGTRFTYLSLEDTSGRIKHNCRTYAKSWAGQEITDEWGEVYTPIVKGKEDDWIRAYAHSIAPQERSDEIRDLEWLRTTIREAARRHHCKFVVIDPWNEIEHVFSRDMPETQYLNSVLREFKIMAREFDIAIVIVAHPDKHGGRLESIDEMSLYSINGGASWKNKADIGIVLGRRDTGDTMVKVDKVRDQDYYGIPGDTDLYFDVNMGIFRNDPPAQGLP